MTCEELQQFATQRHNDRHTQHATQDEWLTVYLNLWLRTDHTSFFIRTFEHGFVWPA